MPVAFLFSIAGSILGAMYSAPFLAAVQGLARLRMRASAAALFSLTGSGLGSGIGPLLVGELATRFAPSYGDEAVRWALVWVTSALLLTALTCVFAAQSFRRDIETANQENFVAPDG
jgi:MFS family permease